MEYSRLTENWKMVNRSLEVLWELGAGMRVRYPWFGFVTHVIGWQHPLKAHPVRLWVRWDLGAMGAQCSSSVDWAIFLLSVTRLLLGLYFTVPKVLKESEGTQLSGQMEWLKLGSSGPGNHPLIGLISLPITAPALRPWRPRLHRWSS